MLAVWHLHGIIISFCNMNGSFIMAVSPGYDADQTAYMVLSARIKESFFRGFQ
jgi:hypothetical protein